MNYIFGIFYIKRLKTTSVPSVCKDELNFDAMIKILDKSIGFQEVSFFFFCHFCPPPPPIRIVILDNILTIQTKKCELQNDYV